VLVLAGCGGGGGSESGSYTYIVEPATNGALVKDFYVTIVSPVPIPKKLLTKSGGKIVTEAQGPQKCSYTKVVQGTHGPGAFLSGKQITLEINGTNPYVPVACSALKKTPFKASNLSG
jgi:hypothetical protein